MCAGTCGMEFSSCFFQTVSVYLVGSEQNFILEATSLSLAEPGWSQFCFLNLPPHPLPTVLILLQPLPLRLGQGLRLQCAPCGNEGRPYFITIAVFCCLHGVVVCSTMVCVVKDQDLV